MGVSAIGGTTVATLWSGGTVTALPMLPGGTNSIAFAINNSGQAVGGTGIGGVGIATLWIGNTATDLGTLPGGTFSIATAINDAGEVVGNSDYAGNTSGQGEATLWSGGTPTALGILPGTTFSGAAGISNAGEVAGGSSGGPGGGAATLWSSGTITKLEPEFSAATAINEAGQIVGNDGQEPVLWSGGILTDLGTLPGAGAAEPYAINDLGQVVGVSDDINGVYATLWDGTSVIDLNNVLTSSGKGWTLEYAEGINDSGEIAGWGVNPQGQIDAFLLTPCPSCQVYVVPESRTWALMLLGLAGLGFAGYRQRQKLAVAASVWTVPQEKRLPCCYTLASRRIGSL